MAIKATLKIQLYANDVIVAESDDKDLWRQVLAAMQSGSGLSAQEGTNTLNNNADSNSINNPKPPSPKKGIDGLAHALGVSVSELSGACDPTNEAPYLHLDEKCWEAFKRNTPPRGAGAVGPAQLAGTLLCLWFKYAGIDGKPTQVLALEVLKKIGVQDKNASRAIKNCDWLQSRPDGIQINPAQMSKSEAVARAFVSKQRISSE